MSAARFCEADTGHRHIVPLIVAIVLSALVLAGSVALAGLPH